MKVMLFHLFILVLFIVFGVVGVMDMQDAEMASAEYTEMVCLGRETNNEYGWPNYKNLNITCGE